MSASKSAKPDARERRLPARPAIPLALYTLIVVVVVERVALGFGIVPVWPVGLAAFTALTLWGFTLHSGSTRFSLFASCTAACALALLVSRVSLAGAAAFVREMQASSVASWEFEVITDPTPTLYGERARARARHCGKTSGEVWINAKELPGRGALFYAVGRFTPTSDDARGIQDRRQGVWGSVSVVHLTSSSHVTGLRSLPLRMRAWALTVVAPGQSDERAVLGGCVLASKTELKERGLDELFSRCGVAHMVAISGTHITVVAALVSALLERARLRPRARLFANVSVTAIFVLVCGAPASAVRAWIMTASAACAQGLGRRSDATSAVCLAGLMMALIDPSVSGQMGFMLSITCVLALTLFGTYATYVMESAMPTPPLPRGMSSELRIRLRKSAASAKRSLAASLVCQLASAPVIIPLFARIALIGPLASLLVTAPLSFMMGLGLAGILLSWTGLPSRMLLLAADCCAHVSLACLRVLARLPMASVPAQVPSLALWLVAISLSVSLLVFWPRLLVTALRKFTAAALAVVFVLLIKWRFFAPARVCVLDVGQGDAILVQDGANALLVDTGPDGSCALALARNHVLHLDAVLITHLHDDHYGGLDELVGTVAVDEVIVAKGVADALDDELRSTIQLLTKRDPVEICYGDGLVIGSYDLRMVSPTSEVEGDENADSVILNLCFRQGNRTLTGLLTGDAERDELAAVLARGEVGDIDFLKVGHHGSEVSLTVDEVSALAPEIAVASAGEGNDYGHPSEECVQMLEESGSRFLCTKDVGDVTIRPGREGPICTHQ